MSLDHDVEIGVRVDPPTIHTVAAATLGPAGPQGEPGPQGPPIITGDVPPTAADGRVDEYYLDEEQHILYGPKQPDDSWPIAINNAPGPAGPPGAAGPPGPPGTPPPADAVVVGAYMDMAPGYPEYTLDCTDKTAVNLRRLIMGYTTESKHCRIFLDNIDYGVPYEVLVQNDSDFSHYVHLHVHTPEMIAAGDTGVEREMLPTIADRPSGDWEAPLLAPGERLSLFGHCYGIDSRRPSGVMTISGGIPQMIVTSDYLVELPDVGRLILVDSPNPVTITIRDQDYGSWYIGEQFWICQLGAGPVTVSPPSGTTLLSRNGTAGGRSGPFVLPGRYSQVELRNYGPSRWVASGDTV
jgi:hypothetical protein